MKYTKEVLEEAASKSESVFGVMRELGIEYMSGGMHSHIKNRLAQFDIDTSHFTGQGHRKGKSDPKRKTYEQILVLMPAGSTRQKVTQLRRGLLEAGVPEKCAGENCPNPKPMWAGKKLVLEIDHVDGNWLDNRIENLRFLCPNCHSQTETSRSWKRQA